MTYLLGKVLLIAELFYPQRNFEFKYKSIHFGQNEPAKLTLFWIAGKKKSWNHHLKAFESVPGTSLHMYF